MPSVFEPPGLRDIVESIDYKPGWVFELGKAVSREGMPATPALYIISDTQDSFDFSRRRRIRHEFLVPPAVYSRNEWVAWIFDRVSSVETHEAGEFFRVNGVREFAPHHGNGENPYRVWHVSDWATADKSAGDD